jgi:hypothetical protein
MEHDTEQIIQSIDSRVNFNINLSVEIQHTSSMPESNCLIFMHSNERIMNETNAIVRNISRKMAIRVLLRSICSDSAHQKEPNMEKKDLNKRTEKEKAIFRHSIHLH